MVISDKNNFFILLYIYLFKFLIALGLCCRVGFSLAVASGGLLFTAVRRLLTVEHWALWLTGVSGCGLWAQYL